MAALSMVNILVNSLYISISFGFSGVLETLVSQAYGNKSYRTCGENLKKCILLCTFAYVPITFSFWMASE